MNAAAPTPHATPADARRAASLLLLRDATDADGSTRLQVLMLRRAARAGDAQSGLAVFPGGMLDPRDRAAHGHVLGADDAAWSRRLGLPEGGLDYVVAAVRETFEEAGILLARPGAADVDVDVDAAEAASISIDPSRLHDLRRRLQAAQAGAADLCSAAGLRLDLRGVHYFSHWLTPPGTPKRFDTRFFAALAPAAQQADADGCEIADLMWLTPQQALDPATGLKMLVVTTHTLQELAGHASAAAALAAIAQRQHFPLMMPRRAQGPQGPHVVLPSHAAYAEIGMLDPAGRGDSASRIVAGQALQLSARVWRLTAPNPGLMTGPGTNSYLVAAPAAAADAAARPFICIDPGPDHGGHLQALLEVVRQHGGELRQIVVTHTHRDHSPGAAALSRASGAPVWGRLADHAQWQDETFAPAHQPGHGERLQLGSGAGDATATLRVIHTPGHASNHLCWLLEEERMLFTGDHVMQGSTVVINPPDGDMQAYLRSLGELLHEDLAWLAPGHGFLVAEPHAVIRALVAHRLRREAKVLAALRATPQGGALEVLTPRAYDDVDPGLHGVARRSLLAHLLKLQADGLAAASGAVWRPLG